MNFGKIFKIFKKAGKAGSKDKGKKGEAGFNWPSGMRIGIYGHANSGKTVYFTVLNEECKISRELQISITDNATAGEFLSNYRTLWGLGTAAGAGTVVDFKGDKKFPSPTIGDLTLQFNAIVDKRKKIPIVSYDYNGRAVLITERMELGEKVNDFFMACDGILFFYDAKILGAELQSQEHVASFVSMLERMVPLNKRLPVPIGLVVTKADILPGFTGEGKTILINPEDENFLSEDFEIFLEKVLSSNKVASDTIWAGTVRNILIRLKDFLKIVTGRTLNFQIFFVSNTGNAPEKIGTDIGRSLYSPPAKIQPSGVKEPFYWLLKSILRNRRISRFRTVAKVVTALSLIWIILYSLPHLYHFKFLYSRTVAVEDAILETHHGNIYNTSDAEREKIIRAYNKYERAMTVRWVFPAFQTPATRIRSGYSSVNMASAVDNLNRIIRDFTGIVRDTLQWPVLRSSDSSLIQTEKHLKLDEELNGYHQGDEQSVLYTRSGRALAYWNMFKESISKPNDTTIWNLIVEQIEQDKNLYGKEQSNEEVELGKALKEKRKKQVQVVVAQKTSAELGDLIETINGNKNPFYRLDTAVTLLRKTLENLDPGVDKANIAMINRYLQNVNRFNNSQRYICKIETAPEKAHVHIEVVARDKEPKWEVKNQIFAKDTVSFMWKSGDKIHIAIDDKKHKCKYGKEPSDERIMKGKFAIFEMDGDVWFDNLQKKIGISFMPPLEETLPVLKP
jgi:GTPase SAR1 family protein